MPALRIVGGWRREGFSCGNHVPEVAETLKTFIEQGVSPGEVRGITQKEYEALYGIACELCDAGDFQSALPIALQLVFHHGRDPRFSFLAGTCLQRLGVHANASQLFAHALLLDDAQAAAMYRLVNA